MHNNNNDRINLILNNNKFKDYCRKNNESEASRKYCLHNLQHSIDVARIAYIINIEKEFGYKKDIIYSVALLHDIGRWQQYEDNIPHNISSAELAIDILIECAYSEEEIDIIRKAILSHRDEIHEDGTLNYLLNYSDKKSRNCFSCKDSKECKWTEEKKIII